MIKYTVCQDFDLTINHKMINFVYLPIIGSKAINLYLYLTNINDYHNQLGRNINLELESLYSTLSLSEQEFKSTIELLEAISLINTYKDINKNDLVVFKINEPLNWSSFVKNKKFMNLLKQKMSEIDFEKTKYLFQSTNQTVGLVNTSKTFNDVFGNIDVKYNVDFDLIYNHIFKEHGCFINLDQKTKVVINNAYEKYHIQYDDLITLVNASIIKTKNFVEIDPNLIALNLKNKIDQKYIKNFDVSLKINRNNHIFLKNANIEEFKYVIDDYRSLNSEQYLACIQKSPINEFDIKLINTLRKEYQLPDFIINILIDYSICINNGRIEPQYIIKVAVTINRLNLNSIEQILNHLQNAANNKIKPNSNLTINHGVKW